MSASSSLGAKVIVVVGKSGRTAQKIAMARPHVPIVTYVDCQKTARRLQMYRGIHPVVNSSTAPVELTDAVAHAKRLDYAKTGDYVIVVSADSHEEGLGTNVTMRIANAN